MKEGIIIAITQASAVLALVTLHLGLQWVDGGQGLHPLIAGAAAVVLFGFPWLMRRITA